MGTIEDIDYFSDENVSQDPENYYELARGCGEAFYLPNHRVLTIADHLVGRRVFCDDERYSAINASSGPFSGISVPAACEDVTSLIDRQRSVVPGGNLIATQDPPVHARTRSLLAHLFTPARLAGTKEFLSGLVDRMIDGVVDGGSVEIVGDLAEPVATLVIAHLLGVPEEDYSRFLKVKLPGELGGADTMTVDPLEGMALYFREYLGDRRERPRGDVLSDLANARYADGEIPTVEEVVRIATLLFSAGRDTTVAVIASAARILAEDTGLQDRLRHDQDLIPAFVEEVLRLEGAIKANFRMTKVNVAIDGIEAPPGTSVMLLTGAMNRDPRVFDNPNSIDLGRKNARDHFAFGRGIHACPGAPLARFEVQVVLERLLHRTRVFRVSDDGHGPPGKRTFDYQANFMIRSLKSLHLILEATTGSQARGCP